MYETVTEVEVERRIAACHETVREVAAYWRSKCADRAMPQRADIDPAELKPYLPSITLVDVVPDERRFVYRLVGTQEVAGRGADPTGQSVRDAFYAESLEAALACYEYVVRERRPFCFAEPYQTADKLGGARGHHLPAAVGGRRDRHDDPRLHLLPRIQAARGLVRAAIFQHLGGPA